MTAPVFDRRYPFVLLKYSGKMICSIISGQQSNIGYLLVRVSKEFLCIVDFQISNDLHKSPVEMGLNELRQIGFIIVKVLCSLRETYIPVIALIAS